MPHDHGAAARPELARRLARLGAREVCGRTVRVASGPSSRLLGLALLDRERAGPGLLLPRCRSVHTFGMRFALDLVFLDGDGGPVRIVRGVPPRRFVAARGARAVLELPASGAGGGAPEAGGVPGNTHERRAQGDADAAGTG